MKHRFALWTAPDWFVEKLRSEFPEVEFVNRTNYDTIVEDIRDADVVVSWSLNADQLKPAAKLRWIHSTAAAIHQLMIPEIINSDILVTNARSVHGPVVAEHVLALIFALAKRLPSAMRMQQQHVWGQEAMTHQQPPIRELRDSTLGLIGTGSIGGHVAAIASAIGMRVFAIRANPQKGIDWLPLNDSMRSQHRVYGPKDLNRVLADADFVVLSAPVTSATTKLIDAHMLAVMKSDAYLINIARGALVDEQALTKALQEKKIGGAALDVFEEEPLPKDSPLWGLDNVLITPHSAGIAYKLWERQYALFLQNLRRFQHGKPLVGLVNKEAEY
ncbi:MAG TPA: D-2-hydroxyacid dehydrogenase [Terriglobales bacterium]|nr:D-2-hydroxyacid dehydrogenase [Terriglobales bacterium]